MKRNYKSCSIFPPFYLFCAFFLVGSNLVYKEGRVAKTADREREREREIKMEKERQKKIPQ